MNPAEVVWIAADPASLRVLEVAGKVAAAQTTLLITGESGTGKDQLARWIHQRSDRRDAPLLKIDCASLPPELVESELFGHERGAFTGAVARKPGRLELAERGTIVLDEVAALPMPIQSKLLRVLEEKTFERLGGNATLRMDARLMALTNANLSRAVSEARFREDLLFRLNVLTLHIPPLRDRRADISPLASHFLGVLAPVHGRAGMVLETAARKLLEMHRWPGNVRELKNAIERAVLLAKDSRLGTEAFPEILRASGGALAAGIAGATLHSLEDLEREAIKVTLEATHFRVKRSAEILGISRKTLLEKRKRYGLL